MSIWGRIKNFVKTAVNTVAGWFAGSEYKKIQKKLMGGAPSGPNISHSKSAPAILEGNRTPSPSGQSTLMRSSSDGALLDVYGDNSDASPVTDALAQDRDQDLYDRGFGDGYMTPVFEVGRNRLPSNATASTEGTCYELDFSNKSCTPLPKDEAPEVVKSPSTPAAISKSPAGMVFVVDKGGVYRADIVGSRRRFSREYEKLCELEGFDNYNRFDENIKKLLSDIVKRFDMYQDYNPHMVYVETSRGKVKHVSQCAAKHSFDVKEGDKFDPKRWQESTKMLPSTLKKRGLFSAGALRHRTTAIMGFEPTRGRNSLNRCSATCRAGR